MDSGMRSSREERFSSLLPQERNSEGHSQQGQAHILGRSYDQASAAYRTEQSPLGTAPGFRYNRIDLSPNSRPLLSQFRLSDHMPVRTLPRSVTGLSDLKYNFHKDINLEQAGSGTHSLTRGLSLNSCSRMDSKLGSSAYQQSRTQSLLDLHKPFTPLETRTAMGSQLSLKSFNNQSSDSNSFQQFNHSYNNVMIGSSENQDRSPPYNVFSYQSRTLNIPVNPGGDDKSRNVIVKSTLCYNTSTQTDIPYSDSMTDPRVGTPRLEHTDAQAVEVTLPKKIERCGIICEEKSVQTSVCRDILNPPLDLKADSYLHNNNNNNNNNNRRYSEVIQHSDGIRRYRSSRDEDIKQAGPCLYNSDRKESGNYIRQFSYEYNPTLESSQKNQTRYASHEMLNGDILHRQPSDSAFFNTRSARHSQAGQDYHSKHGVFSAVNPATLSSPDPLTSCNTGESLGDRCVQSGTDANNNICSHHKSTSDLYNYSDYGSTTGSTDSRHIPSVFPSSTHLGSSVGSQGYSCYTPDACISKSRSSSMTMYDHFGRVTESAFVTSPVTDPAMKVHNLSLTSGVGSDISSMYSHPSSPLNTFPDKPFTKSSQSYPHITNHMTSSPPGSSTFQWKKIVILNPDHIKGARRDSDSVFIDEDEVEPKFLLYKDFRQKVPQTQAPTSPHKLTGHAFCAGGLNQVRSSTDDPFQRHDRTAPDQCVAPSPKPRVHRISESSSLGQIQEEAETLNAGIDKGITSRSEKLTPYNGRSNINGFEKYEKELLQNDVWMRDNIYISSSNLQHRKSEPILESLSTGNSRRSSTDSTVFHRNSSHGGDSSPALSAFRNYNRSEHLTSTYSVTSSHDPVTVRRESDLQITKQPLQKLQTTNKQQGMTSTRDSQPGKQQMELEYYERESNSSSSTLQDVSSLDNSFASVRNQSLSETVAELIFKVNENLNKSAQRMGRIRRSSSSSSRSSLDFIDTTRPERSNRRETDWTRIRSLGSLRDSPERDRWPNWSSYATDYLNDDTGILTTSTPRSSFALSRDKESMLEDSSHNASMDSGLVVSPIYQNFPTKRRPPPKPAVSSDTEPPPLPPRMNREKQPSSSGAMTPLDQEPTQCPVYGKEKHRIEVIPLGKQQDEDVRVDTSKMNFKDLMMQWKNSSPGENSPSSDLRRHEQKIAEKYQSTGKLVSSVPPTLERTKPNMSVASTYRHEPTQKLEATSPVFSSASALSTMQSSTSKSAFSTSPSSPYEAVSVSSALPHHPSGTQPSFNNRSNTVYPGLHNVSSSPIDVQPTSSVAYIEGFSNTTESRSGIKVTLANQNSLFSPAQTPGRISFLANSRSRSSSDLLSVQLPGNDHPTTSEPAPVKLHRFLRDRSSSVHDILSDKSLQSRTQPHHHFIPPQDGNILPFSKSQSAEGAEASPLKSPLSPHGEGVQNTCIADSRLSNSTLALSSGYEITGDNHGFADDSYIGHKNKSSRTVGNYKRSVSAAGPQLTSNPQGKPYGDSDSTPFRNSKLGQQSWNSESVLSSAGTGVKTLPTPRSQAEKGHKDGIQNNKGYINEATLSQVTPVRPPRPNARGRQQAKQSSANPTASSANVSQKTKLAAVSLSALDSLATPASFNTEQGNVSQKGSPHIPNPLTTASPTYGHNQQDHWSMQQVSNSPGTLTPSGQVLDRRPEISPQHSHYSPQHRQLALNNSLNSSLSRASLDHAQPQSLFIQNSTAKPLSPCSPCEQSPVHTPTRDHQRQVIGTARVMTAFNSVEDTPKSSLENSAFSSHYQSGHSVGTPRESKYKSSSTPSLNHLRQPSQEEIECDEKAKELADELDENDKKLLEVLKQDRVKKRMLYMDGLFSDIADDQEKSGFKQKSRSSMKNRTLGRVASEAYDSSGSFKSYSLPRDYQQTPPFKLAVSPEMMYGAADSSSDTSPSTAHENLTVMKHKEELVDKLHKKIQVLKDEKLSLQQEIADNILLGQQVCQVADSRCQTQNEKEKFMTFIDDLEKIVRLLLNLSGQLARAENAVQALGPDTDTKLKKLTWDKREKLHAKHEEAKLLKEAVDKRSEQLLCMLQERLSPQELTDYKHFINMKSRLTIEMQEVDDHLALAEQQMVALQRSLPASAVSFLGKCMEA